MAVSGCYRGKKGSLLMLITDSHGWPVGEELFPANWNEAKAAELTIASLKQLPKPLNLIGDTAYSSQPLTKRLWKTYHIYLTAPPKRHYVHPFHDGRRLRRIARRWKVERCFAWLRTYKRLEVRWERKAENYRGFVELACASMLIKHALYG